MQTGLEDHFTTHPPESTGETTRTKGGSKGKLSCQMKKTKTTLSLEKSLPLHPQKQLTNIITGLTL